MLPYLIVFIISIVSAYFPQANIFGDTLNFFMSKYYGYIGTARNFVTVEFFVIFLMFFSLKRAKNDIFNILVLNKYFIAKTK